MNAQANNAKPTWVMQLPVISTAHMPSADALSLITDRPVAAFEHGGFVYLGNYEEYIGCEWLKPVREWMNDNGFCHEYWVRFDIDADVLDSLPTYEWNTGI